MTGFGSPDFILYSKSGSLLVMSLLCIFYFITLNFVP
jgi:hypothetical protein